MAPSQNEIFQSINESVSGQSDLGVVLAILGATTAVTVAAVAITHYVRARRNPGVAKPKVIRRPTRLMRDAARDLNLRPHEVRALRKLAIQRNIINPLALLLCPSLLRKPATPPGAVSGAPDQSTRRSTKTGSGSAPE